MHVLLVLWCGGKMVEIHQNRLIASFDGAPIKTLIICMEIADTVLGWGITLVLFIYLLSPVSASWSGKSPSTILAREYAYAINEK